MTRTFLLLFSTCLLLSTCSNSNASQIDNSPNSVTASNEIAPINGNDLNLTPEQVAKIKKLNQEIGPKYAAIGQDRSLSGREIGEKKRTLAIEHKNKIRQILNENQISAWENRYGSLSDGEGIKDKMNDYYDNKLDEAENQYKVEIDQIENNTSLSKEEKKAKKQALKDTYKEKKEALKNEKNSIGGSVLLND